ncbi:alpha/beta fold hydrolase [Pseudoroseomonas cervicalis]|uniref:Hydrolase, alpha/beta domain protein n=1 Tax=Pseudoroseomonas cervicalis ATCC 49957 TaxID=525371 RepID=D5RRG3_9PROT|nr:alpha/beta fold hydrolase [Pseudoroseomonas cervicalis]EFH10104.1 hydrolase, alpha/beta domain protein [Pseudoroseomonas cervicalis ATCC 49957]
MRLRAITLGEAAGPPLVLLHGLFGQAQNFAAVQKMLATRFRVIALDLRNHGGSPHDARMDYPSMAADVAETLAAEKTFHLLGHSMGGKVAMTLALAEPARVARLIVADIAPVDYPPAFRPYAEAMRALELRPGLTRREADAALAAAVPSPGVRGFLLQNLEFGATPPAWRNGLAAIAAALPVIEAAPPLPQGARYEGPTLAMSGETSDYIRAEHRPLFRGLFPAVRFATVKGAGHWLHAEKPEPFAATVAAFLSAPAS